MFSKNESKSTSPDIITIGAGPVGLWNAIKIAEENKNNLKILMIERHTEYKRTQRLKLDTTLITSSVIRKKLFNLIDSGEIDFIDDDKNIDIPIQTLEKCLRDYAKQLPISIIYKRFITESQLQTELLEHKVKDKSALEEKIQQELIVGVDDLLKSYPTCKLIIGADGARSTVRQLLVDEKEQPGLKKDLRNMIELKYQVEGKASKLSRVSYFLTQPLLEGLLCSEHVKYFPEKKLTDVTLRFIVDDKIYNDPTLKNINAKNLLPLTKNIPKKLADAINVWVHKRSDKNIIIGSPMLNKTKLSIFSSSKYCGEINKTLVLLLGDASCNYPFMNGLNLGLEMGTKLAKLIVSHFDQIAKADLATINEFLTLYTSLTQETFNKGSVLVNRANNKLTSNARKVDAVYYSSFPIKTSMQLYYHSKHSIFDSHLIPDLNYLKNYVQKQETKKSSSQYVLSNQLLNHLQQVSYDFDWLKALLCLAYQQNESIKEFEKNTSILLKIYRFFGGQIAEPKSLTEGRCLLEEKDIAKQQEFDIQDDQVGSIASYKELDAIIANLYENISLFQRTYKNNAGEIIRTHLPEKSARVIESYLYRS